MVVLLIARPRDINEADGLQPLDLAVHGADPSVCKSDQLRALESPVGLTEELDGTEQGVRQPDLSSGPSPPEPSSVCIAGRGPRMHPLPDRRGCSGTAQSSHFGNDHTRFGNVGTKAYAAERDHASCGAYAPQGPPS